MDSLTKNQRSHTMSRVRSVKTGPELKIKRVMKLLGFAYQPKMRGKPDFANKKAKIVVFVDGCFWHKCLKHYRRPSSHRAYWDAKVKRNVARDKEINTFYRKANWQVKRIWEHELK